jgi:hypothetical protein
MSYKFSLYIELRRQGLNLLLRRTRSEDIITGFRGYESVEDTMPFKDPEKRREYQRRYMKEWYKNNAAVQVERNRARRKKIRACGSPN